METFVVFLLLLGVDTPNVMHILQHYGNSTVLELKLSTCFTEGADNMRQLT